MDLETAIQAFGSSGHDLPHEVLQWTLDHWEEVAPELLGMLERYISGADRSDEAASAMTQMRVRGNQCRTNMRYINTDFGRRAASPYPTFTDPPVPRLSI